MIRRAKCFNAVRFLVQEELRARTWAHVRLAEAMRMHGCYHVVYEFLDGKRELDEEIAHGLELAFGVRAEWWLSLNDLLKSADAEESSAIA